MLNILKSFFCNAAKYHPKSEDAGKTTYFSPIGADFIYESAFALHKLQPTSPLFSQHENLLQFLATSLQVLYDDLHLPPDYLFFASFLYVLWLLRFGLDEGINKTDAGQNLILAILEYHARVSGLRRDIEDGFYDAHSSLVTFEDDWPQFVEHAEGLGILLPPPVVRLPTDSPAVEGAEIQEEPCQPFSDAIVDIVDSLGERTLQDDIPSSHSSSETAGNDATT